MEDLPLKKPMKCPVCGKQATLMTKAGEKRNSPYNKDNGVLFVGEAFENDLYEVFDPNIDHYLCDNRHDFYIAEYFNKELKEPDTDGLTEI